MDVFIVYILFAVGVYLIVKGGDWFVDAAVWIAETTGIPKVLIGATIVSLATTLPELLVSSIATLRGHPEMAIGNVVGSVICNMGLILSLAVIIRPQKIEIRSFALKGFIMLISGFMMWFAIRNYSIDGKEGNIFLFALLIYIIINVIELKNDRQTIENNLEISGQNRTRVVVKNAAKFIVGSIFVVIGARLLVTNGEIIARNLGIPERIIALTLIALGTSLPELVTSITAAIKGHEGISIGNILGANILDIVMVIGITSKIAPLVIKSQNINILGKMLSIPQTVVLDIPVALLLMVVLLFSGLMAKSLGRKVGFVMLSIYTAYLAILFKYFI
jgi:cation:H+ antiporter